MAAARTDRDTSGVVDAGGDSPRVQSRSEVIRGVSTPVVLASGSPRRLDLLRSAGLDPVVCPGEVDETPRAGEEPRAYVARLAELKALASTSSHSAPVVAADTTVDCDGRILGKPRDATAAAELLRELSGRSHLVHTGVAVRSATAAQPGDVRVRVVTTTVTFADLDEPTIDWYISTGEPFDKAGGYGIQGAGACLVERVEGSVTNVIGLPLVETLELLRG